MYVYLYVRRSDDVDYAPLNLFLLKTETRDPSSLIPEYPGSHFKSEAYILKSIASAKAKAKPKAFSDFPRTEAKISIGILQYSVRMYVSM